MEKRLLVICILIYLVSLAYCQVTSSGTETLVNTTTANSQQYPAIAMDKDGDFVIIWESFGTDGDGYGIYSQRYDAGRSKNGLETLVNSTTSNDQRFPDVAMDANGNYTVVWMDESADGDGWGIYGKGYNSSGVAISSEFLVNTTTTGNQKNPAIAKDEDGDFVVVWMDINTSGTITILGQLYNSSHSKVGGAFQVNTSSASFHGFPKVSMDRTGDFVVCWQSTALNGTDTEIYAQRYNSSAAAQGSETLINTTTAGNQIEADIASDSAGNYVIVWSGYGQDGDEGGIYAARYNNEGTVLASEFAVATTTSDAQVEPAVACSETGNFMIIWGSEGTDGSNMGTYFQMYDSLGNTQGGEVQVNTRTTDSQHLGDVAMYGTSSEMVLVWQDGLTNSASTNDGDDYGLYLQGYNVTPLPVSLLSFDAIISPQGTVTLHWNTTHERDNEGFYVQRIAGGTRGLTSWEALDFVPGVGNSSATQQYTFEDIEPRSGTNYYRLKQMDLNGSSHFSEVRVVEISRQLELEVYPIPADDYLSVQLSGEWDSELELSLTDMRGLTVLEQDISRTGSQTRLEIAVKNLATGTYVLTIKGPRSTQSRRISIRHD